MYYVYLIQNPEKTLSYVGYTSDLKRRIKEHISSEHQGWELVYYEAYRSEEDARIRERKLKHHGKGLHMLKKLISNSLNRDTRDAR